MSDNNWNLKEIQLLSKFKPTPVHLWILIESYTCCITLVNFYIFYRRRAYQQLRGNILRAHILRKWPCKISDFIMAVSFQGTQRQFRLTLGMEYEILAQILLKTALTQSVYSVQVPQKQAARYLTLFWQSHFRVLPGNFSLFQACNMKVGHIFQLKLALTHF